MQAAAVMVVFLAASAFAKPTFGVDDIPVLGGVIDNIPVIGGLLGSDSTSISSSHIDIPILSKVNSDTGDRIGNTRYVGTDCGKDQSGGPSGCNQNKGKPNVSYDKPNTGSTPSCPTCPQTGTANGAKSDTTQGISQIQNATPVIIANGAKNVDTKIYQNAVGGQSASPC